MSFTRTCGAARAPIEATAVSSATTTTLRKLDIHNLPAGRDAGEAPPALGHPHRDALPGRRGRKRAAFHLDRHRAPAEEDLDRLARAHSLRRRRDRLVRAQDHPRGPIPGA